MVYIRSYLQSLRQFVYFPCGPQFWWNLPGCLCRIHISSFNHSRTTRKFHSTVALSSQILCLRLSARILTLTALKFSSKMPCPVNLKNARGQETKPAIISRTSRVTSCRGLWCWAPRDLLKGQCLFLRITEMSGWRSWRKEWRSWLSCWTWWKLRYISPVCKWMRIRTTALKWENCFWILSCRMLTYDHRCAIWRGVSVWGGNVCGKAVKLRMASAGRETSTLCVHAHLERSHANPTPEVKWIHLSLFSKVLEVLSQSKQFKNTFTLN